MEYRREIDGLRAVAVVPVVFFHAGIPGFSGGFVGVDVFFAISGYLITTLIINDLEKGRFSLLDFYERRARRILPALFFVMACCLPFAWLWLMPDQLEGFSKSLIAVPLFISNIMFWNESGYFDTGTENKPLLHTWSLAVEEQYYVVFPLLMLFFWHRGRKSIIALLGSIFVFSILLSEWGWRYSPSANYFLIPFRAWEIMTGAFVAILATRYDFRKLLGRDSLSELICGIGLLMIIYSALVFDENTPFPSFYGLLPTVGCALIIMYATNESKVGRLLGNPILVGIGLISYSAYLWHQPVLAFARLRAYEHIPLWGSVLLVLISFGAAYLTYRFVETPFRNKKVITRQHIFRFSLACSLVFVAIGILGYIENGWPERLKVYQWGMKSQYLARDCEYKEGMAHNKGCLLGNQGTSPSFAIWGDSFASANTLALNEMALAKQISGRPYILSNCPSILGVERNEAARLGNEFAHLCLTHNEEAFADIINSPTIKTVIITSAYEYYLRKRKIPILVKRSVEGDILPDGENRHTIIESLKTTLEKLAEHGKRVILIMPHHSYKAYWEHAIKKTLFTKDVSPEIFQFSPEDVKPIISEQDLQFIDSDKMLFFIYPNQSFCKDDICSYINDKNEVMVSDGAHFSLAGSQKIVELLWKTGWID